MGAKQLLESFDSTIAGVYAASAVAFLCIFVPLAFQLPKNLLESFHQLKQEIINCSLSEEKKKSIDTYQTNIIHFFYATDILITCGVIHTFMALINIGLFLLYKTICIQILIPLIILSLLGYVGSQIWFICHTKSMRGAEWTGISSYTLIIGITTISMVILLFILLWVNWNFFVFIEFIISCIYLVSWFIPGIKLEPLSSLQKVQKLVLEIKSFNQKN